MSSTCGSLPGKSKRWSKASEPTPTVAATVNGTPVRGIELPLVISDHADWDGLTATIAATGAGEIWVTHGQEDALVHWCKSKGLAARPLDLVGYGDEDEGETAAVTGEGEAKPDGEATS